MVKTYKKKNRRKRRNKTKKQRGGGEEELKEGELEELFTNDIENILEDKRQRGLL